MLEKVRIKVVIPIILIVNFCTYTIKFYLLYYDHNFHAS